MKCDIVKKHKKEHYIWSFAELCLILQQKRMVHNNVNIQGSIVLITGIAGFIGSNLAKRLIATNKDITIVGIDNLNDYYDINLKKARLEQLYALSEKYHCHLYFVEGNIADMATVEAVFRQYRPRIVVNLAAQAGVRYGLINPRSYIESNIVGFFNILEVCKESNLSEEDRVQHLIFASSSSVYGANKNVPYSTNDKVDMPVSLYAATKKSDELLAHAYSKNYNLPTTGLRFFTVYGPEGRPDMAYYGFTDKLVQGKMIQLYNYGNCQRDFTYIDDIVEGIIRVMQHAPERKNGDDGLPIPPYKLYNIGNNQPVSLIDFVNILQEELVNAEVLPKSFNFDAHKQFVPMQPGDVMITYADTTPLEDDFGYKPSTPLKIGLRKFAQWYKQYHDKDK